MWQATSVSSVGSTGHESTKAFIESSEPNKGKQCCQMIMVLMLPVAALIGKASVVLAESLSLQQSASRLHSALDYHLFISEGVRKVELERGMTSMFLSGGQIDPEIRYKLAGARIETDNFLDESRIHRESFLRGFNSTYDYTKFRYLLKSKRRLVDLRRVTLEDCIVFYTTVTIAFLETALEISEVPSYTEIWHSVVSFRAMTRTIDNAGIQRALGSAAFSHCGFSRQNFLWFMTLDAETNTFLNTSFRYFDQARTWFEEGLLAIAPVPKLIDEQKRSMMTDQGFEKMDCANSAEKARSLSLQWFQSLTQFMSVLADVASATVRVIKEEVLKVKASADREVLIYSCVACGVTLLCVVLSIWYTLRVLKMTNKIHDFVVIAAAKTSDVNTEKMRTEKLLYQMMPRSVAERLKRQEEVLPKTYSEVTVYFSDIIDWSDIASSSTPLEIVNLLNNLYSTFDGVIDKYDVYKVETIADSYMCVSGLPEPNGSRHVQEIAEMSLRMLHTAQEFIIPHMVDRTLNLRAGFHSGSCVAGVVGTKMPRYCLFGDTVNTASRMETNGEALKIHISDTSNSLLESVGGFVIEPRGEVTIKGKGSMETFWLVSHERWQPEPITVNE